MAGIHQLQKYLYLNQRKSKSKYVLFLSFFFFITVIIFYKYDILILFQSFLFYSFERKRVVSLFWKQLAWLAIVLLNCYFIYFSVIRGLQRGSDWQKGYIMACCAQIFIEVVFYQTSECVLFHFIIPNVVYDEVRTIHFALKQTVHIVCSNYKRTPDKILDAPKYLFLSTNLAKYFPHLIESIIIQSYHFHLPGELGKKWMVKSPHEMLRRIQQEQKKYNNQYRTFGGLFNFTFTSLFLQILMYIGSSPSIIQRVFLHSLQPIILAIGMLLIDLFRRHPLYLCLLGVIVLYKAFVELNKFRVYRSRKGPIILQDIPGSKVKGQKKNQVLSHDTNASDSKTNVSTNISGEDVSDIDNHVTSTHYGDEDSKCEAVRKPMQLVITSTPPNASQVSNVDSNSSSSEDSKLKEDIIRQACKSKVQESHPSHAIDEEHDSNENDNDSVCVAKRRCDSYEYDDSLDSGRDASAIHTSIPSLKLLYDDSDEDEDNIKLTTINFNISSDSSSSSDSSDSSDSGL